MRGREQWEIGMRTRVVALLLASTLTACGLTMTHGPDPRTPPDQRPQCTETMDAPKRDAYGAMAGLGMLLVGALFLEADDDNHLGVPLIVGGSVLAAASYASGGIGYFRVNRCQRAISDYEQRMATPRPLLPAR